jgi:predicted amidophosphoribosyltransferase
METPLWQRMVPHGLIRAVYPPHCLACGEAVSAPMGLCGACWAECTFFGGTVCDGCGTPLPGDGDGTRLLCDDCLALPRPWSRGRAAIAYRGTGRRLALSLKNHDRTDLPRAMAGWMLRAAAPILTEAMLVAPVPLHRWRLLTRRYNQSALLSAAVARAAGLPHCPDLLARRRATPSQQGGQDARFENVADAFAVPESRRDRLAGREVLLVDDVMTSGATLGACAEACLRAGAREVRVLALARAVRGA